MSLLSHPQIVVCHGLRSPFLTIHFTVFRLSVFLYQPCSFIQRLAFEIGVDPISRKKIPFWTYILIIKLVILDVRFFLTLRAFDNFYIFKLVMRQVIIFIFLGHIESIIQLSVVEPFHKREVFLFLRLLYLLIVCHP